MEKNEKYVQEISMPKSNLPAVHLILEGLHGQTQDRKLPGVKKVYSPLTSSVTAIIGQHITIVDTGTPAYSTQILRRLRKLRIDPHDVGTLLLTHGHQDHYLNANLFPEAMIITETNISMVDGQMVRVHEETIRHPDWEIFQTPGHCEKHFSVRVNGLWDGKKRRIVIAGDAFREDLWESGHYTDPDRAIMGDLAKQAAWTQEEESVGTVLKGTQVLIPGHGPVLETRRINQIVRDLETKWNQNASY